MPGSGTSRRAKPMSRRDYGSGSISERSKGHWRVTVPLPRDPTTGERRRHRFTVKGTRRDAQKALREALHERDHGGVGCDSLKWPLTFFPRAQ